MLIAENERLAAEIAKLRICVEMQMEALRIALLKFWRPHNR
jgi:hypothetical protein